MAFFNEFPHTRTYDSDLGWIIKEIAKLLIEFGNIQDAWKEFIEKFNDKLSDTVIKQLTEWLNDGTLANMLLFTFLKVGHLGSEEGLLVGGLSFPNDPTMGLLLSTDGNTSWGILQSQKPGSKTELTIQSKIYLGLCNVVNGVVTRLSGNIFNPALPLKYIWIDNTKYAISHYVSGNSLVLQDTSVNKNNVFYQFIAEYATGIVNTNGKTVTYISGDQFAYWWVGENITINNTIYTIDSVSEDGRSITLNVDAPVENNVQFLYESEASNDVSTLGINKMSGANEERIVLTAKSYGEYRLSTVATGQGKHYPLAIDVGGTQSLKFNLNDITINKNITMDTSENPQIGFTGNANNSYFILDKNTDGLTLYQDNGGNVFFAYPSTKQIAFKYLPILPVFTTQELPANAVMGAIAFNSTINAPVYYHDGWKKFDNTNV